jgi:hypothetical protein
MGRNRAATRKITADVVAASYQADDDQDDKADDSQTTTAEPTAARGAAPVFDVVTQSTGCPVHKSLHSMRIYFIVLIAFTAKW